MPFYIPLVVLNLFCIVVTLMYRKPLCNYFIYHTYIIDANILKRYY
ncbi:hypothetical protein VPHD81_0117 [Vibrio phage D81]